MQKLKQMIRIEKYFGLLDQATSIIEELKELSDEEVWREMSKMLEDVKNEATQEWEALLNN